MSVRRTMHLRKRAPGKVESGRIGGGFLFHRAASSSSSQSSSSQFISGLFLLLHPASVRWNQFQVCGQQSKSISYATSSGTRSHWEGRVTTKKGPWLSCVAMVENRPAYLATCLRTSSVTFSTSLGARNQNSRETK